MLLQEIRDFYWAWPWMLLLLSLIPLGWWWYLRMLRRQLEQVALNFSYTALVAQLQTQSSSWQRVQTPIGVSLLAVCLIMALARPVVVARVPVSAVDMMLALDISISMMAEDIQPNRLTAAKEAAVRFVQSLPRDSRIGLLLFAGDNYVLSPPTAQHGDIVAYLRALSLDDLRPRTEIGSALHTALDVLRANRVKAPVTVPTEPSPGEVPSSKSQPERGDGADTPRQVVVLLSDGDNTGGYPPRIAAQQAYINQVTVFTVGIGSEAGSSIVYRGLELPVTFNEATLRDMARLTGGQYFRVFSETDFQTVYDSIRARSIRYEERELDLAFLLAGVGLVLLGVLVFRRGHRFLG